MSESSKEYKFINDHKHILHELPEFSDGEISDRASSFYELMNNRRSVRHFSNRKVPPSVIEKIIMTASSSPSGAHKQPWTFCAISNPEVKRKIRIAAEKEEKENYESRMSDDWKEDLEPIGTDMHKPFLETVPWLIVAFKKVYDYSPKDGKQKNYYVNESVGIACGMLIASIHNAGLATLTHTPSPMNFLSEILERPKNERAFLLFPVGFPADNTYVPDLKRKPLDKVSKFYE